MRRIACILGAARVEPFPGLLVGAFRNLVYARVLPQPFPGEGSGGTFLQCIQLHRGAPEDMHGFIPPSMLRIHYLICVLGITNIVESCEEKFGRRGGGCNGAPVWGMGGGVHSHTHPHTYMPTHAISDIHTTISLQMHTYTHMHTRTHLRVSRAAGSST